MDDFLTASKTPRGFSNLTFTDIYGTVCSIQKSSLADDDAIWFGADTLNLKRFPGDYTGWHDIDFAALFPGQQVIGNERMHLSRDQVKALLPTLIHFAETGELP